MWKNVLPVLWRALPLVDISGEEGGVHVELAQFGA